MYELISSHMKELIIVAIGLVGLVLISLQKCGLLTFSKGCPDPECSANVHSTSRDVAELKDDFKEFKKDIYAKIDATTDTVARLDGFIRGKFE